MNLRTKAIAASVLAAGILAGPAAIAASAHHSYTFCDKDSKEWVEVWFRASKSPSSPPSSASNSPYYNEAGSYETGIKCNPEGSTGPAGPAGPKGATGATGATGAAGTNGQTGSAGPAGATGAPGAPGATGAVGPKGNDGNTGSTGATGPAGLPGTPGAPGGVGPTGAPGAPGQNGATGPVGPTGATGANGNNGATGSTGAVGEVGPKGDKGDNGLPGVKGDKGADGITPVITLTSNPELCKDGGIAVDVFYAPEDERNTNGGACLVNGVNGLPGKDGKDGKTTIVIKHVDGTTEEVPVLPATGSETNTWAMAGAAAVLLAVGTGSVVVARRRKS